MPNNKAIQILRGSSGFDPSDSSEELLDGQLFYSKKNKQLYIGDNHNYKDEEDNDKTTLKVTLPVGAANVIPANTADSKFLGNVGIGDNPDPDSNYKLKVKGNSSFTGTLEVTNELVVTNSIKGKSLDLRYTEDGSEKKGPIYCGDVTAGEQVSATKFKGDLEGNAATATKASQDSNGKNIADTYMPKSDGTFIGPVTFSSATTNDGTIAGKVSLNYDDTLQAITFNFE